MHRSQILGAAIEHLRQMAIEGAPPAALLSFLEARSGNEIWLPFTYLDKAFLQGKNFLYTFPGPPLTESNDQIWRRLIEERRSVWQAQKAPQLMRLRDYFSFMQFAQEEQVTVVVCGAHPSSGRWIGTPGVRCYGGRQPIPTSQKAPDDGLLAADPADTRLMDLLGRFDPPLSYAGYVEQLDAQGLRVLPAEVGFLVTDAHGNRLHDSYRLHSVFDPRTNDPVWVQPRAERLRASLNRHLGTDLVLFGPHDAWSYRNDKKIAGPLWGPQRPAIQFGPDQEIEEQLATARDEDEDAS